MLAAYAISCILLLSLQPAWGAICSYCCPCTLNDGTKTICRISCTTQVDQLATTTVVYNGNSYVLHGCYYQSVIDAAANPQQLIQTCPVTYGDGIALCTGNGKSIEPLGQCATKGRKMLSGASSPVPQSAQAGSLTGTFELLQANDTNTSILQEKASGTCSGLHCWCNRVNSQGYPAGEPGLVFWSCASNHDYMVEVVVGRSIEGWDYCGESFELEYCVL